MAVAGAAIVLSTFPGERQGFRNSNKTLLVGANR
jgi:hypothetical protein